MKKCVAYLEGSEDLLREEVEKVKEVEIVDATIVAFNQIELKTPVFRERDKEGFEVKRRDGLLLV